MKRLFHPVTAGGVIDDEFFAHVTPPHTPLTIRSNHRMTRSQIFSVINGASPITRLDTNAQSASLVVEEVGIVSGGKAFQELLHRFAHPVVDLICAAPNGVAASCWESMDLEHCIVGWTIFKCYVRAVSCDGSTSARRQA